MAEKNHIVYKPRLVRRSGTDWSKTLGTIGHGQSLTVSCKEAGTYGTANNAVTRYNKILGRPEYMISSKDNGATYTLARRDLGVTRADERPSVPNLE